MDVSGTKIQCSPVLATVEWLIITLCTARVNGSFSKGGGSKKPVLLITFGYVTAEIFSAFKPKELVTCISNRKSMDLPEESAGETEFHFTWKLCTLCCRDWSSNDQER